MKKILITSVLLLSACGGPINTGPTPGTAVENPIPKGSLVDVSTIANLPNGTVYVFTNLKGSAMGERCYVYESNSNVVALPGSISCVRQ